MTTSGSVPSDSEASAKDARSWIERLGVGLRRLTPRRRHLVEYSPALIAAAWLALTWESKDGILSRLALAAVMGFFFQAALMLTLAIGYAVAGRWLGREVPIRDFGMHHPQMLGALLAIVGLWILNLHRQREDERALITCLEDRAERLRSNIRRPAEERASDGSFELYRVLDLREGGLRDAVKECKDAQHQNEVDDDE